MRLWSISACVRALFAAIAPTGPESRVVTLGQVRADMAHEVAAKMARVSGILDEWRLGRRQDSDLADALTILRDTETLCLRHSRLAVATMSSFAQLTGVISTIHTTKTACARAFRMHADNPRAIDHAESVLNDLRRESRRLVEMLSARHAVRFGDLVTRAAEEIKREYAVGQDAGVPMVVDDSDGGFPAWVASRDAARWIDILRNLVRNAVQAVLDFQDSSPAATAERTGTVTVRLRPAGGRGNACVEIIDDGIGMTQEQIAQMWGDGLGRHGAGHGHGLTADKRAFLENRAELEVCSAPGMGTCVRIELKTDDVTIRMPHRWAAPPLSVPAGVLAVMIGVTVWQMAQREMISLSVTDECLLRAIGDHGHVLWHKKLEDRVMPNYKSVIMTEDRVQDAPTPQLVIDTPEYGPCAVISTIATRGPGRLLAFDSRGGSPWEQILFWTPPQTVHTNNLISAFQAETVWNPGQRQAIVINVRDRNWSSTSVQFFDCRGRRLGEYLHPGHVEFVGSADFDGDGRTEVLLSGKNNDATHGTAFWPSDNQSDAYAECLIMLETPNVEGQAFPYRRWPGQPDAVEEGYLLIPPLRENGFADPKASLVTHASFGPPCGEGRPCMEISMADGRIYSLDGHLRPLTISVGDHTPAALLDSIRTVAPLLYLHAGMPDTIMLDMRRGM